MAASEADRVKMASQVDISNNEVLNLRPQVLLVPIGISGEANVINRSKYDPTASSAFERPNIVGGLFSEIIGSPRLTASTTRRYLFTDPSVCSAILVAFLNGSQAPFMDQRQGWNVDGTELKIGLESDPPLPGQAADEDASTSSEYFPCGQARQSGAAGLAVAVADGLVVGGVVADGLAVAFTVPDAVAEMPAEPLPLRLEVRVAELVGAADAFT